MDLLPRETEVLMNKTGATRLGFAVLLKFFQLEAAHVLVKSGGLRELHWHQNADE